MYYVQGFMCSTKFMSPVPPVFHTVVTVNIGLKYVLRVGTSFQVKAYLGL